MEHEDAIRSRAVERYLLDQMVEDERAIFEEHYFDCRVCAADITEGMRLMVVGREVVGGQVDVTNDVRNVVPIRRWFEWIPATAATAAASVVFGLLGAGAGYRIAQVRHRPPTELVQPIQIATGVFRAGTIEKIPDVHAGDELRFDVVPHDDAASYVAVITCGKKIHWRHGISREMAAGAIAVRIGELPAGRCALVIEGVRKDGNRFEITNSPFEVGERAGVR